MTAEQIKEILSKASNYMFPNMSRGPACLEWVETMKQVAEVLEWPDCPDCDLYSDGCPVCYGVKKANPDWF
jgi:hypothetical protein